MSNDADFQVPEGFAPFLAEGTGMLTHVGPIYFKIADGKGHLAFRVMDHHLNPAGDCHGGMLATVVDVQCGFGSNVGANLDRFLPTISLTCDYLEPGKKGDWIVGHTEVVKVTRRMVFCEARLMVDDRVLLRANGIMKLPSPDDKRYQFRTPHTGD